MTAIETVSSTMPMAAPNGQLKASPNCDQITLPKVKPVGQVLN